MSIAAHIEAVVMAAAAGVALFSFRQLWAWVNQRSSLHPLAPDLQISSAAVITDAANIDKELTGLKISHAVGAA